MKKLKSLFKTKLFKTLVSVIIVVSILVPSLLAFAEQKAKYSMSAVTTDLSHPEEVDLMHLHRNDVFTLQIKIADASNYNNNTYAITYDNSAFEYVRAWSYSDLDGYNQSKIITSQLDKVDESNPKRNVVIYTVGVMPNDEYEKTYSYNGVIGYLQLRVKDTAKGNYNFDFANEKMDLERIESPAYYDDETGENVPAVFKPLSYEVENAKAFVEVPVDDITLNVSDEIDMIVGQTQNIEITPNDPDTTVLKNATYSSTKQDVADVSTEGVITAKKTGQAEITVNAYGFTKKVKVNVTNPIKKLYFSEKSVTIKGENKTLDLSVKMEPTNPDNASVKWESLNEEIASVDTNGRVTSHKAGKATIKVTAVANEDISAVITVNVVIPVTNATIDKTALTLNKNATEDVTITYEPITANSEVEWTVDDDNIATVAETNDAAGKFSATIKGLHGGKTTVKGKITNCEDSVTCEFNVDVTVNVPLEKIKIQKDNKDVSSLAIYPTETANLKVVIVPEDATIAEGQVVAWSSDNDNVTVTNDGVITGVNAGTSATVTANYAGKSASITVNVKTPVEGGNLSPSDDLNLITKCDSNKGKCQEQLQVIFVDVNGKTPDEKPQVTWGIKEGSPSDVASVSNTGLVKALKAGNTIVTATYKTFDNKLHTLEANVHVTVALESIAFEKDNLTINRGKSTSLPKLILNPTDATVDLANVEYEYDSSIISLNNNTITGIKKGTTTIKAKLANETAEITVVVAVPVEDIIVKLNDEEVERLLLERNSSYVLTAEVSPLDADYKDIKWSIAEGADQDVISINSATGAINTLKKGKTKITVKAGTFEKTIDVEVNVPVKSFKANSELEIYKGEANKKVISTTITPIDADDQEITWESADEDIATVDESGTVTGHKAGTTTITGTLKNGMKVTVSVTVSIIPLTDIDVVVPDEILKGRKTSLTITPNPINSTEFENIEYESSNEEIFTVDEEGNITGLKEGSATLIIRVGGITKEIAITIKEIHADSIDVVVPAKELGVDEEMILQPFANPSDCTDELTYTYSSSDENIAVVSEDGTVKGISEGTVTIKVTASNGMEKEIEITITKDPQFRVEDDTTIPNTNTSPLTPNILLSIISLLGIVGLGYKKYKLDR